MNCIIGKLKDLWGRLRGKGKSQPYWIEAENNRFGIPILDCQPFSLSVTAWTSDKDIAETFVRLRESDGAEHIKQPIEEPITIPSDLCFPYDGNHDEGPIFKAKCMEDKWDMYVYGDHLYISRSWTGQLSFIADCAFKADRVEIGRILAAKEYEEYEPVHIERLVDFLIKSHMSNMIVPHPLPDSKRDMSAMELAQHSFSVFGTRGVFGTFEETKRSWDQQEPEPIG